MYQVIAQQRPGRPRWALGASAILLLATVGLAAALIRYKTGGENVFLKSYPIADGLEAKLPVDWKPFQEDRPDGTLVALAEPIGAGQAGRRLFVFLRQPDFRLRSGGKVIKSAAEGFAGDVLMGAPSSGEMKDETPPSGFTSIIAGRPGVTVVVRLLPRQGGPPWFCLARATLLSRGLILGVALQGTGEPHRADIRLLDRVSHGLELPGARPGAVPEDGDEPSEVPAEAPSAQKVGSEA